MSVLWVGSSSFVAVSIVSMSWSTPDTLKTSQGHAHEATPTTALACLHACDRQRRRSLTCLCSVHRPAVSKVTRYSAASCQHVAWKCLETPGNVWKHLETPGNVFNSTRNVSWAEEQLRSSILRGSVIGPSEGSSASSWGLFGCGNLDFPSFSSKSIDWSGQLVDLSSLGLMIDGGAR